MRWVAIALLFAVGAMAEQPAPGDQVVRGQLVKPVEDPVVLQLDNGGTLTLEVGEDMFHALHDPLLADRTWEFWGKRSGDDSFTVRRMFTVKNDVLHQVTYYCDICHIVSYRPGPCMCCQKEVELRELPADE